MIGFHWFPPEHKLKKRLSTDHDGLHEKWRAGNYQDRSVVEKDLEGRSEGPHWRTSEGSFRLCHESTRIPREARAASQASTFTDGKWRWCGEEKTRGLPFQDREGLARRLCFPPLPYFLRHSSVRYPPPPRPLAPTLRAVNQKHQDFESQDPLSCISQKRGGKRKLELMAKASVLKGL